MSVLRVRFPNVTFFGQPEQPDGEPFEGFGIQADGFDGWDDGVDTDLADVDRTRGPGSFDTEPRMRSRMITITGFCVAPTERELDHYRNMLMAIPRKKLVPVDVDHHGSTLRAYVRRVGKTQFRRAREAIRGDYQLQLWAPDPRKYGRSVPFGPGTTVTAHHFGNTGAAPVLVVAGSMASGYTIEGPDGAEFSVTQAVTTGHPHTIDMRTGLLSVDGAVVYGQVSSGDTWEIPAGSAVSMTLVPVAGSGTLTATVRDTFE